MCILSTWSFLWVWSLVAHCIHIHCTGPTVNKIGFSLCPGELSTTKCCEAIPLSDMLRSIQYLPSDNIQYNEQVNRQWKYAVHFLDIRKHLSNIFVPSSQFCDLRTEFLCNGCCFKKIHCVYFQIHAEQTAFYQMVLFQCITPILIGVQKSSFFGSITLMILNSVGDWNSVYSEDTVS